MSILRLKLDIHPLVNDILEKIPDEVWKSDSTTFFDPEMGSGELLLAVANKLRTHGHDEDNIRGRIFGLCETQVALNYLLNKFKLVGTHRVADFLNESLVLGKKKFDVIICNPPYTNGVVKLYAKYFDKSLKLANMVVFIMPSKLSSTEPTLKFHNERVLRHSTFVSDNVIKYFKGVGYLDIRYVVAKKSVWNEVEEATDKLSELPLLYPRRARMVALVGEEKLIKMTESNRGVDVVFNIYRDRVEFKRVAVADVKGLQKRSVAPWLVFVNRTPGGGKFNTHVAKNDNVLWSRWVFAFEANSKKDAESIRDWLVSPTIQSEINRMREVKNNTHTVSKTMLDRLPVPMVQ